MAILEALPAEIIIRILTYVLPWSLIISTPNRLRRIDERIREIQSDHGLVMFDPWYHRNLHRTRAIARSSPFLAKGVLVYLRGIAAWGRRKRTEMSIETEKDTPSFGPFCEESPSSSEFPGYLYQRPDHGRCSVEEVLLERLPRDLEYLGKEVGEMWGFEHVDLSMGK